MSLLLKTIVCIGSTLLAAVSMKAEDEVRINKQEFERLWAASIAVVGEVESYTPGNGDGLTYQYDGIMHAVSDSIAVVKIPTDEKPAGVKKLRVSVPEGETPDLKLLRQAGTKITFLVPLLYVKYDPWGFVPFNDLKEIKQVAAEIQKSDRESVVLGLKIVQLYKDGVHADTIAGPGSISFSEAKAEVTTDNYRGKIVQLGFPNSHEIAKLKPNDVIKIRISRRITEEHLEAVKDPAKAYSHLNSPDFVVLEINGSAPR